MQVAFEKGTHLFWSVGKDRSVKYWDGDKVSILFFLTIIETEIIQSLIHSSSSSRNSTVIMVRYGPWPHRIKANSL